MAIDPVPPTRKRAFASWHVWVVVLLLGLLVRAAIIVSPPPRSMRWDHHEYVQWGVQMLRDGLLQVHTEPPPDIEMYDPDKAAVVLATRDEPQSCNYPPLAVTLLYGQACVLQAVDPGMVSNTKAARLIFSSLSVLGDVLVAFGCMSLVRRWREGDDVARRTDWPPVIAFAAAFLAPPLILDSCRWGQTDSWSLAALVWMVHAMMGQRWWRAGLFWGIALSLKPQAVLAGPVWLAALLIVRDWRVVGGGALAALAFLASGLPFTVGAGWDWLERSYLDNLLNAYPYTTLKAFNVWYLDLLVGENQDARVTLLGVSKDTWGKVWLMVGLAVVLVTPVMARVRAPRTLLPLAAAVFLLAVMLPTRVHERYIVLPIPFLIATAAHWRRAVCWPALLIVAATFQVGVLEWMRRGAHSWGQVEISVRDQYAEMQDRLPPDVLAGYPPPEQKLAEIRPQYLRDRRATGDPWKEWLLTLTILTATTGCCVGLFGDLRRRDAHTGPVVHAEQGAA